MQYICCEAILYLVRVLGMAGTGYRVTLSMGMTRFCFLSIFLWRFPLGRFLLLVRPVLGVVGGSINTRFLSIRSSLMSFAFAVLFSHLFLNPPVIRCGSSFGRGPPAGGFCTKQIYKRAKILAKKHKRFNYSPSHDLERYCFFSAPADIRCFFLPSASAVLSVWDCLLFYLSLFFAGFCPVSPDVFGRPSIFPFRSLHVSR